MTGMSERVLVVDDEPDIRNLVVFNLRSAGFRAEGVGTGAEALTAAAALRPAVVVIDLMLPDVSGTEVCRLLRANAQLGDVAIMMLTARDDEHDRVVGFEAGTDDYVAKPFDISEIVARVRALARCAQDRRAARRVALSGNRLMWNVLEIDRACHRAFLAGVEIALRPLDHRLMLLLLENPGHIFTRGQLLRVVWDAPDHRVSARMVDAQVKRLRLQLGAHAELLETVNGLGYRLRARL